MLRGPHVQRGLGSCGCVAPMSKGGSMTSRRTFLKGVVASSAAANIGGFPLLARAQAPDVKIGIVAIRAGIACARALLTD